MDLDRMAAHMLSDDPKAMDDARAYAGSGNTLAGAALGLATGSPRWATEAAVSRALAELDAEPEAPSQYRVEDMGNARLNGRPVTLFALYERQTHSPGYVFCGRYSAEGHDATEAECIATALAEIEAEEGDA